MTLTVANAFAKFKIELYAQKFTAAKVAKSNVSNGFD